MTAPRPICVHCHKRYGARICTSETVRWPADRPMPAYRGNGITTKVGHPYKLTTRAILEQASMGRPLPEGIEDAPLLPTMTATRWIWDGVSWSKPYEPFCTLRCALDYARKAWRRAGRPR